MSRKLIIILSSRKSFYGVVLLLIVQAAWIALSSRYPMAFDEDCHVGIIRLYAHHLSPFWSHQPPNADVYGAIYRDPSYLYQYLLSFPYRLMTIWIHSTTVQVIILRFISIGLFAASLPLYRRLLLKAGLSSMLTHAILTFYVLIPVVPLLAAQINYDNLLLPLTAWVLLLAERFSEELRAYKRINIRLLTTLLIVCLLASLVKYAFLPIFVAVFLFLGVQAQRTLGLGRKFWKTFGFGITLMTKRVRWLLAGLLVVSGVLFTQRYAINLIDYHTPVPACNQVLSVQRCKAYGPWDRDYNLAGAKSSTESTRSPFVFTADWFYGMWLRLFFAVAGPDVGFETRGPLVLPGLSAIIIAAIGFLLMLRYWRRIIAEHHKQLIGLFVLVIAFYIVALWLDEYRAFLHTGQAVAINGRYLFPIMLPFLLLLGLGFRAACRSRQNLKLAVAGIALVCFIWGGGFLTYVLRSRDAWYWSATPLTGANHAIQKVLTPIVPGSRSPVDFL